MSSFDWCKNRDLLRGFGGVPLNFKLRKTGLPFFDALRLYGMIDLWVGIREDISITDLGHTWQVVGRRRPELVRGRAERAFQQVWKKKKPDAKSYCGRLLRALENDAQFDEDMLIPATKAIAGIDAALQAGIRDAAAAKYVTLQSGQTSESTCCVAKIPLSDALLAFAGSKRTEGFGDIVFLPIFNGRVDLAKVVSPLRIKLGSPNVLCAEALALLSLKGSLLAEGYQGRLTGIVFKTNFQGQRSDNYSGFVGIGSTALDHASVEFVAQLHHVFRDLVGRAWVRRGRGYETSEFTGDALAMAYWLMHPVFPKHLSALITSQERLHRGRLQPIFTHTEHIKEAFEMSYEQWKGDHEAIRKFAEAVASGIFYARMLGDNGKLVEDSQKAWYNEVTLLRSASSPKSFLERSMILIEQGHREDQRVGTGCLREDFDPAALLSSIGDDGSSFEAFRDLFRMYLVQASYWPGNAVAQDRSTRSESSVPHQTKTEEGQK